MINVLMFADFCDRVNGCGRWLQQWLMVTRTHEFRSVVSLVFVNPLSLALNFKP